MKNTVLSLLFLISLMALAQRSATVEDESISGESQRSAREPERFPARTAVNEVESIRRSSPAAPNKISGETEVARSASKAPEDELEPSRDEQVSTTVILRRPAHSSEWFEFDQTNEIPFLSSALKRAGRQVTRDESSEASLDGSYSGWVEFKRGVPEPWAIHARLSAESSSKSTGDCFQVRRGTNAAVNFVTREEISGPSQVGPIGSGWIYRLKKTGASGYEMAFQLFRISSDSGIVGIVYERWSVQSDFMATGYLNLTESSSEEAQCG